MISIKDIFISRSIKNDSNKNIKLLHPRYQWSIVYDVSTEPYINQLKQKLQKEFQCKEHDINIIGIQEKDKSLDNLSYDSFDLLGNLNSKYFDKALIDSCEYLIFYTENESLFHKYLENKIKNNLQIGLNSCNLSHDLIINLDAKETPIFVNELKKYLSKIKHKNEAI